MDASVKQILLGNLSSQIRGKASLLLTGDETLLKVKEMIADLIRETRKEDPEEIKIIVSGKLVTPDTAAINTIHMDDDPQDNYKWENWLSSGHILWKPNNHVGPQPIAPEDAKRQVSSTPPTRGYIPIGNL